MLLPVCVFMIISMTLASSVAIHGAWPGLLFVLFGGLLTGFAFGSRRRSPSACCATYSRRALLDLGHGRR
jgi:hypothetical protein